MQLNIKKKSQIAVYQCQGFFIKNSSISNSLIKKYEFSDRFREPEKLDPDI